MQAISIKWLVISFITGCLVPLCFAPFDQIIAVSAYLIFPLFALFFLQIRYANSFKNAFLQSWAFGFGMFLTGISWLYVAIHEYGSTPWWLAGFFTLGFIATLALFYAVQGAISYLLMQKLLTQQVKNNFKAKNSPYSIDWLFYLILFPVMGIIFEWLRSWILTGLPWLLAGYSQLSTPLAGYAAIVGVYGLSLISLIIAGGLAYLYQLQKEQLLVSRKLQLLSLIFTLFIFFVVGSVLLQQQWTQTTGAAIKVSMVQGNLSQQSRWDRNFLDGIKQRYYGLSEDLWQTTDILVWPENAIPIFYQYEQQLFFKKIQSQVNKYNISFITGVPYLDQQSINSDRKYYNSLLKMEKNSTQFYFKRHLVPFGEYLPLESWLRGLIKFFNIPMSGFSLPPSQQHRVTIKGKPVAITLCYEDVFPELLLNQLPQAQFLINLSNNGWYGNSLAPHQHLQIAQMRALETGRDLLRSTTSGISALIDSKGRIKSQSKQFEIAILSGEIQPRTGATPFVNYGNTPLLLYVILSTFILLIVYLRPINLKRTTECQ
ncbi:MAG: apolipoprotein N-acyltransferase [Pseudomonadota bacterium]